MTFLYFVFIFISGINNEIVQISARNDVSSVNIYIKPKGEIPSHISNLTGIRMYNGVMTYNYEPVQSVDAGTGLQQFLDWLPSASILIAHNAKFDSRMLIAACQQHSLQPLLTEKVHSFVDTLPVFKALYPGRKSYSQQNLFNDIIGETYAAHNSMADVTSLQKLITPISKNILYQYSFSLNHAIYKFTLLQNRKSNISSFNDLVQNKIISKNMASQLAENGLNLEHLQKSISRNGVDGLKAVVKNRVKNYIKISNDIYTHLSMD